MECACKWPTSLDASNPGSWLAAVTKLVTTAAIDTMSMRRPRVVGHGDFRLDKLNAIALLTKSSCLVFHVRLVVVRERERVVSDNGRAENEIVHGSHDRPNNEHDYDRVTDERSKPRRIS